MEYDDFKFPSLEDYEKMAKAYSTTLRKQGFIFVKLEEESQKFLVDEIFDILFKIDISIDSLSCICDAREIKNATTRHISLLRNKYNYTITKIFNVEQDEKKIFLGLISLENLLTMKLFMLSLKSDETECLLDIIFERLQIYSKSFDVSNFKLLNIQ